MRTCSRQHSCHRKKPPFVLDCDVMPCLTARDVNLPAPFSSFISNIPVIVAAVLHDVIDDTDVPLSAIRSAFGEQVEGLVLSVSKLSQMNQLLRRGKRQASERGGHACSRAMEAPDIVVRPTYTVGHRDAADSA